MVTYGVDPTSTTSELILCIQIKQSLVLIDIASIVHFEFCAETQITAFASTDKLIYNNARQFNLVPDH